MILGLTGSYGSGKSTVSLFFRERGIRVIDADEIAVEVTKPGTPGHDSIMREFGEEYRAADGSLDRRKLARLVFNNPAGLKRLEEIVHPLVREREFALLQECSNEPLAILSAPLLFEKGLDRHVDKTLLVIISEDERFKRLMKRGLSREEIQERLKNQMPQEEKAQKADYIIDNSENIEQTRRQVENLLKTLIEKKD